MIVACDGCQTSYKLPEENVPERDVRVRCPKCSFVWRLLTESTVVDEFRITRNNFDDGIGGASMDRQQESPAEPEAGFGSITESDSGFKEISIGEDDPAAAEERAEDPEMKKKRERAKRLARVFVSDILVYNQEKRDRALADGNLISVLGPEIKKSWEGYRKKVAPEIKESNEYFKEALNNILAEGEELF